MTDLAETMATDHTTISVSMGRNTTEGSIVRLNTIRLFFRKRKSMWILLSILVTILIVLVVTIPTILVLKKKEDKTTSTITTTTTITTTITQTTNTEAWLNNASIDTNTKWTQNGTTVAGGNGYGNKLNQVALPTGIYIDDDDQTIYIADQNNNRIIEWKFGAESGQVVAGGNGYGSGLDQLYYPSNVVVDKENDCLIICDTENTRVVRWPRRNGTSGEIIISDIACFGLAMDDEGYLYISNFQKNEVKRWKTGDINGTVIAGGNGRGNDLDQLDSPNDIFVDLDHSLYISDQANLRVMKWTKDSQEGIVVAHTKNQLNQYWGMTVDQFGHIYVADGGNHEILRWVEEAAQGIVIAGGNGMGSAANQFATPAALSFDQYGNLYVVDRGNSRIQKFSIDPN